MADLTDHRDTTLHDELLALLIHQHCTQHRPVLERLWNYYRNDLDFAVDRAPRSRPYRAAQEQGLPQRLTQPPGFESGAANPREVVIENDIAWRIHTLVDFMFGQPVAIQSLADDAPTAALIEQVINTVFDANGGITFFQDMALLGSIYGYVDLLLRADELPAFNRTSSDGPATGNGVLDRVPPKPLPPERALRFASSIVLEAVEAPRAIPVLDPADYRRLDAYLLHYTQQLNQVDHRPLLSRLIDRAGRPAKRRTTCDITEHFTAHQRTTYRDGRIVEQHANPLGRLPVVHVQNLPQPFFYEGLSEVEPLIPLQDELNTRLSDRANRVTMQSFKMYLGKGIENFLERPVSPGQMWLTDNPAAEIQSFGGDGPAPSEDAHISEIREAMDKTSAVTPVAAGLLRNKVGNLTSENALRITMLGLLARTQKKRVTYGQPNDHAPLVDLPATAIPHEPLLWPVAVPDAVAESLHEPGGIAHVGHERRDLLGAHLGGIDANVNQPHRKLASLVDLLPRRVELVPQFLVRPAFVAGLAVIEPLHHPPRGGFVQAKAVALAGRAQCGVVPAVAADGIRAPLDVVHAAALARGHVERRAARGRCCRGCRRRR